MKRWTKILGMHGQNLLKGRSLTSTRSGATKVYTFTADIPGNAEGGPYMTQSPTANSRVLIATPGFAALGIVMASGNSATFAYTVALPGQSSVTQTKSVTRQGFRTPGTVCS